MKRLTESLSDQEGLVTNFEVYQILQEQKQLENDFLPEGSARDCEKQVDFSVCDSSSAPSIFEQEKNSNNDSRASCRMHDTIG